MDKIKKPTLYLAFDKEGNQLGLYDSWENAQKRDEVSSAEFWNYDEKTGRYYPSGDKVCRLDILPTKEEYEKNKVNKK